MSTLVDHPATSFRLWRLPYSSLLQFFPAELSLLTVPKPREFLHLQYAYRAHFRATRAVCLLVSLNKRGGVLLEILGRRISRLCWVARWSARSPLQNYFSILIYVSDVKAGALSLRPRLLYPRLIIPQPGLITGGRRDQSAGSACG